MLLRNACLRGGMIVLARGTNVGLMI